MGHSFYYSNRKHTRATGIYEISNIRMFVPGGEASGSPQEPESLERANQAPLTVKSLRPEMDADAVKEGSYSTNTFQKCREDRLRLLERGSSAATSASSSFFHKLLRTLRKGSQSIDNKLVRPEGSKQRNRSLTVKKTPAKLQSAPKEPQPSKKSHLRRHSEYKEESAGRGGDSSCRGLGTSSSKR